MARKKKAGTRAGKKNLIRTDDVITNQYGVQITKEEARQLRNMVQTVNRKRKRMLEQFKDKPLFYGKRELPEDRQQLALMGEELDLMIRKRSGSLNQFRTQQDFKRFMRNVEQAASKDYEQYRAKLYKQNYMEALKRQYGEFPELLKGALMKVRMTPLHKFAELVGTDRLGQIKEHYSLGGKLERLKALREKLGLRNPDYDEDEEY